MEKNMEHEMETRLYRALEDCLFLGVGSYVRLFSGVSATRQYVLAYLPATCSIHGRQLGLNEYISPDIPYNPKPL